MNKYLPFKNNLRIILLFLFAFNFSYKAKGQSPIILDFMPSNGPIGSLVTIAGTNLNNPTSVSIGGVSAIIISNTDTSMVAMLMPGTSTGVVSITTGLGTDNSSGSFTISNAQIPVTMQGTKLVGTGATGAARQGYSIAMSADGTTAIVGGYNDDFSNGAAWIFIRSGTTWTQQGSKLVGTGQIGPAPRQGFSVSISADGNTAMVGGYLDNSGAGAVWIYTRTGSNWTQQGNKLVGTGATGAANQGWSVSLSADGNTATVGGYLDNTSTGAVWVFTRSGGTWTQQGNKLLGTGAVGTAQVGYSVSISSDGNTMIAGGYLDNSNVGAAWVFTRSGSTWTQQGNKLVGTGAVGASRQGNAVGINADGNTVMVAGYLDNSNAGAIWNYTRSGSTWTQQGNKLVGTGATGAARQGISLAITADGNSAIIGGSFDNSSLGASWIYTRTGGAWSQQGNKLVGSGAVGNAQQGFSVSLSANGNHAMVGGNADNSNEGAIWILTYVAPPNITDFAPSNGPIGTLVTIRGTNFSNASTVIIGGIAAIIISQTDTSIAAMVMPGAMTGVVSLTANNSMNIATGNFTFVNSSAPNSQLGNKLVGTGASGAAKQGYSLAISADGTTAVVGGAEDNTSTGAAWIYTRSGSTWTQQGSKLVGTGAVGTARQGTSIAISADGNTALVGGYLDNSSAGAVWVYTRNGSTWTQQGNKLFGTGATGTARQGWSISLSADGNTAVVGGYLDNTSTGAVWVFTRSGGTWTQLGNKLVGAGAIGTAQVGYSVSLSSDGNTLIAGGYLDNSNTGAAWVFTRSGSTWIQQGNKLVGTGAVGASRQGNAVGINADGNTVMVAGYLDNSNAGAIWLYTRSGSTWSQQGNKLVGTGATGAARQGSSLDMSADGNTAIIGASSDNTGLGAAWIYTRTGVVWSQQGEKMVGIGAVGDANLGASVSISADGNQVMIGGPIDNGNIGAVWGYAYSPPPTISEFSPRSGSVGTLVTITGTNLNFPSAKSIGGVPALLISYSATNIVAMVMPGATTGTVSVTASGAIANASSNFILANNSTTTLQVGNKIVGTGAIGNAQQGTSVSVSADGLTAIVGGWADNTNAGAAWIYTRSGNNWTQQGNKLVGTGAVGSARQGFSVAMSADGNTAVVGGLFDNSNVGAIWIYTKNGGIWTQQGNKLVGIGAVGSANQGKSVSISADGNTVLVGGYSDNTNAGATWVFVRNGDVWSQQGNKLVGTVAVGAASQGTAVSLSADGNTAIVGGNADNTNIGAAWVFTRSGSTWTQQGSKLVGTSAVGTSQQGVSVSISANGNTALVGGSFDNSSAGSVWVYVRSGSTWTQEGNKLGGSGVSGTVRKGTSVSLSADGNTGIWGGVAANSNAGAVWIFKRSGTTWSQQGSRIVGTGAVGAAQQGKSVTISADGYSAIIGGSGDNGSLGAVWELYSDPSISDFNPTSGPVGSLITITGNNLSSATGVTIGGDSAIIISNSGTSIVAMVMPNTDSGFISVTYGRDSTNSLNSFTISTPSVPNLQQGNKLIGSGYTGVGYQGQTVSISADGNTAIVGGFADNNYIGAAWIYTRNGTTWSQQNEKLIGSGATGAAYQGKSVAISADGNTAIVGGHGDNSGIGAIWVFIRNGTTWSQQGNKLVGTGTIGSALQGNFVSISADGNTVLVGGPEDNGSIGASWVFTRTGNIWTQQGNKLVGTGAVGSAQQGYAVSLSLDGNSALIGAPLDNNEKGATWLFTRNSATWTQVGSKLVGSGSVGNGMQGYSVSINADGSSMIIGGPIDNNFEGGFWGYTRSLGGTWQQTGAKIVGTGGIGSSIQGNAVSISADGLTALVGGYGDNSGLGAAWIFKRSGSNWIQEGNKLVGRSGNGIGFQGSAVSISSDGNTAIIGGTNDNSDVGAAWMYTYGRQDYYSQTSGDPATLSNWNSLVNGSGFSPNYLTNLSTFYIQNGHVMSTTSPIAFGTSGSTLQIQNGGTLNVNHAISMGSGSNYQIDTGGLVNLNYSQSIQDIIMVGGKFTIASGRALSMNGTVTSTGGVFSGSATSNLTIMTNVGTLLFDQTTPGTTNLFQNIIIGVGSDASLTLGNTINISPTGSIQFNASGTKIINSGGFLNLKSSALGTAYIGNTNNATISGNISVERYLPPTGRKFRFLASPVVGATSSNWRNMGENASGLGIHITGIGNNFDPTTSNNSSAFSYNEVNAGSNTTIGNGASIDSGWTAFADGNSTALTNGIGFRVLVRGDRTIDLATTPAPAANPTTIKVTGTYPISPVTIQTTKSGTNPNSGYNLVGNPFPCSIDWNMITKTNIASSYYVYSPATSSYQSWNGTTGNATRYISSGQGFFVLTTALSGSLSIGETHKISGMGGSLFKSNLINHLKVALKYDSSFSDEIFIHFRSDATEGQDDFDAPKLINSAVNIASMDIANKKYNINCLPELIGNRDVLISVLGTSKANYSLIFNDVSTFSEYDVFLVDSYLKTQIKVSNGYSYQFQINNIPASYEDGRFKLSFNKNSTGTEEKFTFQKGIIVYPTPFENVLYVDLIGTNEASFIIYNQIGEKMIIGDLKQEKSHINTSHLASGVYFLTILKGNSINTIKVIK